MKRKIAKVILVDVFDQEVGSMEKMEAHEKGLLHRAFSVFVFDKDNRLLMQKRASHKYHSGGLWTNTCCSHPEPNESVYHASKRRLMEEMGFTCDVESLFEFVYHVPLDKGLTEHEYDHVMIGHYDGFVIPNKDEVEDFSWMGMNEIEQNISQNPEQFTVWFKLIFPRMMEYVERGMMPSYHLPIQKRA